MRIRVLSDIHAEVLEYSPQHVEADLTVLAGDIHHKGYSVEWALDNFKGPILLVAGNHEFYGTTFEGGHRVMRAAAEKSKGRLYYLERDSIIIDGVRFLGVTCWTDYRLRGSPSLAKFDALRNVMDFRAISTESGDRLWTPDKAAQQAYIARTWIEKQLSAPFKGRTVLVTHHAPSEHSLDPRREQSLLDSSFANGWEHLFGPGLDLIIHGHTHYTCDYEKLGTRVVSNPRGYPGEDTDYNPSFLVSL